MKTSIAVTAVVCALTGCGGSGTNSATSAPETKLLAAITVADMLQLQGSYKDYRISRNSTGYVAVDANGASTSIPVNIKRLIFSDGAIGLDISGNAGQAYRLYQAAFDRQPDLAGLSVQIDAMDKGVSLAQISQNFIDSPEFRNLYGADSSNATLVTRLYNNVLHRAPEQAGFDHWVGILDAKTMTRAEVLYFFSESPENQVQVLSAIQGGVIYLPPSVTSPPPPATQKTASGGSFSSKIVSLSPNTAVYEQTVLVADPDGNPYANLAPTNFAPASEYDFTCQSGGAAVRSTTEIESVTYNNGTASNYAALMLFDRSGSMVSNDPNNLSLAGGRAFVQKLGPGDSSWIWAFPGGTSVRPSTPTSFGTGLSNDGNALTATLDRLEQDGASGSTPLYESSLTALRALNTQTTTAKKALLLFTDGQATDNRFQATDVITEAKSTNVPIFTLGLKQGDTFALYDIASQTGGAFFFASEANSLVSIYGSLGAVLSGRAGTYTVRFKRSITGPATLTSGGTTIGGMKVNPPAGSPFEFVLLDPFLVKC
ncbi:DUF4214 domain-containing protein [Noviherbaspirillum sp.]|uniref:DUF4214 domain-containing protein n=1 Tax=Noviherbaspirillum sp. TaxID=1926288 RepID=UPI002FE07597